MSSHKFGKDCASRGSGACQSFITVRKVETSNTRRCSTERFFQHFLAGHCKAERILASMKREGKKEMEKKREAPRKGRRTKKSPHGLYRRRPENILSFIRHKRRDLGTVAANTSTASSIQFLATVSTSPSPYLRRQKRCETRLQEIYSIFD